jgi:hypothetical protein
MSLVIRPERRALNGRFGRKTAGGLVIRLEEAPAGSAGFCVIRMNFAFGEFV